MKDREVHPPAAAGDSTLEVEWVDAVGRPVSQAPVILSKRGVVTTGMDGRAVVQGLPPGHYLVTPQAREQWIRYAPVAVELRSAETRRIRLQPEEGWILSGQIVDDGGKPIEGATLAASRVGERRASPEDAASGRLRSGSVQGTTGPDGRFTLAHLPEGPCTLRVSLRGYALDASASSGLDGSTTTTRGEVVVSPGGRTCGSCSGGGAGSWDVWYARTARPSPRSGSTRSS
ncbi:carboxypeptidase regulatory-like domain-containing protein [Archangium gephyra]|nr:carboxypeptidase regulatory-like domain-containing protein [Archangium gephyra]